MTWLWLAGAVVAGAGAYVVGWPAWRGYRDREARDLNAERYLAWRGRADRNQPSAREGLTGEERRRLWIGAGLGLVAAACLVAFFTVA